MKTIPLTQGKVALIDDEDYDFLNQWKWCAMQNYHIFYATHGICIAKGKWTMEQMHRLILGLQPGDNKQTDHRDGNGLNNQRSNLRSCTTMQNQQSSRKKTVGTSKYKGVHWHRCGRKWCSQVSVNKKQKYLGLFNSEANAARAYDITALQHHGQFALTNKMLGLL